MARVRRSIPNSNFTGWNNVASLTTAGPANSNIAYTAVAPDANGNAVTVRYVVAGASTPLSVSVVGSAITVNVATNASSVATSTGSQVLAAIAGSGPATALVSAALAAGNSGAGVVAAFAATPLTGGTSRSVGSGGGSTRVVQAKGPRY